MRPRCCCAPTSPCLARTPATPPSSTRRSLSAPLDISPPPQPQPQPQPEPQTGLRPDTQCCQRRGLGGGALAAASWRCACVYMWASRARLARPRACYGLLGTWGHGCGGDGVRIGAIGATHAVQSGPRSTRTLRLLCWQLLLRCQRQRRWRVAGAWRFLCISKEPLRCPDMMASAAAACVAAAWTYSYAHPYDAS